MKERLSDVRKKNFWENLKFNMVSRYLTFTGQGAVTASFVKDRFNEIGLQEIVVELDGNRGDYLGFFCPLDKEKMNVMREDLKFESALSRPRYLARWQDSAGCYFKCSIPKEYPHWGPPIALQKRF